MNKRRKGISLIVLVITILVMLILSGVVIVSLSKNNPVEKAKEATFKQDIKSLIEEYTLYLSNKIAEVPGFNHRTLYANKTSLIYADMDPNEKDKTILDIIKSLKGSKYEDNLEIIQGEIFYKGKDSKYIKWLNELGVKIYNLDSAEIIIENGELVSVSPNISGVGTLVIPEGVNTIGPKAFYGCKNLTSVILPESITEIPASTFAECISLEQITLPSRLTEIKDRTFYNCRNLKEINLPNGVITIGEHAFEKCISLRRVTGTENLQNIKSRAFFEDSSLEEFKLGSNLQIISDLAFYNTSIKNVVLPDSLVTLGSRALSSCPNIKEVKIGRNVQMGDAVFRGSKNITNIEIDINNPYYKTIDGSIYSKTNINSYPANTLLFARPKFPSADGKGVLNIAPNTVEIAVDACCENNNITKVVFPNTVKKIGTRAFLFMYNLKEVNIPASVNSIAQENFIACPVNITVDAQNESYEVVNGVLYAKLPNNVKRLVAVPSHIGPTFEVPDNVVEYSSFAFAYNRAITTLKLSRNAKANILQAYTCYNMSKLQNLIIPNNVETIRTEAITNCESLQKVELEEGVKYISHSILTGNPSLKEVILPTTLKEVYGTIITSCPNVTVKVREGVENPNQTIGMLSKDVIGTITEPKTALSVIDRTYEIVIPEGVKVLGDRAIALHRNTPSFKLPKSLTTIGNRVLENTRTVTSIKIPSKVTDINQNAFIDAGNLVDVTIDQYKAGNALAAKEPWGLPAGTKAIKWK